MESLDLDDRSCEVHHVWPRCSFGHIRGNADQIKTSATQRLHFGPVNGARIVSFCVWLFSAVFGYLFIELAFTLFHSHLHKSSFSQDPNRNFAFFWISLRFIRVLCAHETISYFFLFTSNPQQSYFSIVKYGTNRSSSLINSRNL